MSFKMRMLVIVILVVNLSIFAQWQIIDSGTSDKLYSITFSNDNNGVAVGINGTIVHTSDGGLNWETKTSATTEILYSVIFPNEHTGYAVGKYGTVIKTVDFGNSWFELNSETELDINSVFFMNNTTGYIVGRDGLIKKTIDGGVNWNLESLGTDEDLESVVFIDDDKGFIVGENNQVFKTENGGNDWNPITLPESNESWDWGKVFFLNENIGFISGSNGGAYKTIDSGNNWVYFPNLNSSNFCFVSETKGFKSFSSIYKTINEGMNWICQSSPTSNTMHSMFFIDENLGFMVGSGGSILRTTNGGGFQFLSYSPEDNHIYKTGEQCHMQWESDLFTDFTVDVKLYQSDSFIMDIASVNTQNGNGEYYWIIPELSSNSADYKIIISDSNEIISPIEIEITLFGESDPIFYRHDLPSELSNVQVNYMDIYNDQLWLCGSLGTVAFSSDDDFENWTIRNNGIPSNEHLVWMDRADIEEIFITASYSGKIYRTTDYGQNWNLVFEDASITGFINYIKAFPATGEVIVQGDGVDAFSPMAFLYSDDYGATWTNNNSLLLGISNPWKTAFISEDCGYTTGNESPDECLIYKTTNWGLTWTAINPFYSNPSVVNVLNFKNENIGVVSGSSGLSLTIDGGTNWYLNEEISGASNSGYFSFINDFNLLFSEYDSSQFLEFNETGIITRTKFTSHPNYLGGYSFFKENKGFICAGAREGTNKGYFNSTVIPAINSIHDNKNILNKEIILYQNYPNPFNPTTTIKFALSQAGAVKVNIYNVRGGKIAEVVNGYKKAGYHTVEFDGSKFTSGIYFYSLETNGRKIGMKKMILVK